MSAHAWINEIPPVLLALALGFLAFGAWKDSEKLRRVSYLCFVVAGVFTIVMVATGEQALRNVGPESIGAFQSHRTIGAIALSLNMICFMLAIFLDVLDDLQRFRRVAVPLLLACGAVTLVTVTLALGIGKALTG